MKIITDMLGAIEREQIAVALDAMKGTLSSEELHVNVGVYRGLGKAADIIQDMIRAEDDRQADL